MASICQLPHKRLSKKKESVFIRNLYVMMKMMNNQMILGTFPLKNHHIPRKSQCTPKVPIVHAI